MTATASIAYLDGVRLRRALQAGIHRVISRQDYLNKINVFPVADGDTGTNIAFTLHAILAGMASQMDRHVGRMLGVVADSALDGARGNSGAILAQFFQGLCEATTDAATLSTERFTRAVRDGAQSARSALSEPREGTLLTVLSDFACELREQLGRHAAIDFQALLAAGLERAQQSLADTPNKLEVLRKAGVVDAGAQGFVELLQGIVDFISAGSLRAMPMLETPSEGGGEQASANDEALEHRYCTECIIEGADIDRDAVQAAFATLGSSLVIAGSRHKVKVHIHVDDPRVAFRLAESFGDVSGQKADDMLRQREDAHLQAARPAVITDSGADIPPEMMEKLNIHMVPVRVHFGSKDYLDKISLTPQEFYAELERNPEHPKTSQPAPGDFRRQFRFLASHYEAVVSINLTAKVSGTWQAARSASERCDDAPVTVIDSLNVSVGQGLLVMYAAECALAGLDAAQIVTAVKRMIPRTFTWGALKDLRYGVRGGRVAPSKKFAADVLHLTPVLTATPDGFVKAGGVLVGRRHMPEKFARFIARKVRPGVSYRLGVGHCNAPDEGAALLELLRGTIPQLESTYLMEVGPALGVHAGPGSLVVGLQEYTAPA